MDTLTVTPSSGCDAGRFPRIRGGVALVLATDNASFETGRASGSDGGLTQQS